MANTDKKRYKEDKQAAKFYEHTFNVEKVWRFFLANDEVTWALLARVLISHDENVDPEDNQYDIAEPEDQNC